MLQVTSLPATTVTELADSDAALIRQVKQRHQPSFKKLYDRHLPTVYGLCMRLTGNRQMAEEATQEAFILVWRKIDSFKGESAFGTWLHSLTSNSTISYLRRQKSWLQRMRNSDDYESLANDLEYNAPADIHDLLQWLPQLPERARMVFVLHGIEGYRQEQVAKVMGISVGTVKAQFHKASSLLKQWLETATGESA